MGKTVPSTKVRRKTGQRSRKLTPHRYPRRVGDATSRHRQDLYRREAYQGAPTGTTLAKDGAEGRLMLGQTLAFRCGQLWRHQSSQDQPGRKASGVQTREGLEATWLPSPQPDSRVKHGEGGQPAQGDGRQETWQIYNLRPPVQTPGSGPTREANPSGYRDGYPNWLHGMVIPQGREVKAKRDHDWGEATANGPPEVPKPHQVVKRPPTQRQGSSPLEAKQESPGERTPRSRRIHEKEAPGAESPSRGNALGRKHQRRELP